MKTLVTSIVLCLSAAAPLMLGAQPAPGPEAQQGPGGAPAPDGERVILTSAEIAEALTGTWIVDLTPQPGAAYHESRLVIGAAEGNTVEGQFYGSPLEAGFVNALWGPVHFGFTTRDGSAAYHTAVELVGNVLHGTTRSAERSSLWVWTATRPR